MRNVIVTNIVSVDGYYEGPRHNVMVLNMDAAFDAYNLERIRTAGTVLLGRTSYQVFSSHWPKVADAPADPDNPALSADNRELSRIYNKLPKTVVSDTYAVPTDNPWHDSTTVIGRADAADWVANERNHGHDDILVFGSRTMWNGLLKQGLVDELHLMIGPTAVASGTPTFDTPTDLILLGHRQFDGSANVLLRYGTCR